MKKKQSSGKKVEFSNIVWVIDNLDSTQIKNHDENPSSPSECFEQILTMVDDGFKVGMKYDEYNKSYMVYATNDLADKDNGGLAISARGNDLHDATSILLYKYFVVASRDLRGFTDIIPKGLRG